MCACRHVLVDSQFSLLADLEVDAVAGSEAEAELDLQVLSSDFELSLVALLQCQGEVGLLVVYIC